MMDTFVMRHLPALLIATPLFAAFLMPLVGSLGPKVRSAWVFLGALATAAVGLALAGKVLATGTVLYVFGAAAPHVPLSHMDSRRHSPSRNIFQVDALSALRVVIASLSSLGITDLFARRR
jgi:multicomponent Na+:H+ antiporter subunit D